MVNLVDTTAFVLRKELHVLIGDVSMVLLVCPLQREEPPPPSCVASSLLSHTCVGSVIRVSFAHVVGMIEVLQTALMVQLVLRD